MGGGREGEKERPLSSACSEFQVSLLCDDWRLHFLSHVEEEKNDVSGVCPKHLCSPYPKLSSVERAESGEAF